MSDFNVEGLDFAKIVEKLHAEKYTGPVTLHFAQGHPNVIEFPGPKAKIGVDKKVRRAHT